MIIAHAPVRISLLGGGTDYPSWSAQHGGLVVGGAINHYSLVMARYLPPFHDYKSRVVYSAIETVKDNLDIQHRAVKACLEHLGIDDGLEIFHAADLPGRSGTGSSSAFVVSLLHAVSALDGVYLSPAELRDAAIEIEQGKMGECVGCQDQAWAAHGGLNFIQFRQSGHITVTPLDLGRDGVKALEAHLLLFFTRESRTSSAVAATYVPSLLTQSSKMWAMMKLAEDGISALYSGNYERLGQLIDSSWRLKSSLGEGVNTQRASLLYNTARLSGAWGGKLTGAGGGGCLILVAPPEKHPDIIQGLTDQGAVHVPFRFDFDGSRVIHS